MKILYASCACSEKVINKLFRQGGAFPAQKYHKLLSAGLASQDGVKVVMVSALPLSRRNSKRIFWRYAYEPINDNFEFHYMPFINVPILRHLIIFISTFIFCFQSIFAKKDVLDKIVVCDILNITVATAAMIAAKLCGGKSIAIVTDIPAFMQYESGVSMIKKIIKTLVEAVSSFFMKHYDAYIVLTEQMNKIVNPNKRPRIVIEGIVDSNMKNVDNRIEDKFSEKVIIYAGVLYEKYGVKRLMDAFEGLNNKNARLWLYGSGELEDQILELEKRDERVRFFGHVPNDKVVTDEIRATLLLNPRPSSEEFTKYSFPSKNMEYMVSGTPLLTTKLPGMPKEYYDYGYLFDDESVEGMAKTLDRILKLPKEELHAKGTAAKEFVLREKNNIVQAKRILDMIKGMERK